MATVEPYETANGQRRYRVRYRTPDRRQTDKRGFTTKRDANAFAATVEHSKLTGGYISPSAGRVTVAQVAVSWEAGLGHLKPKTRENSLSAYRTHVKPRWGNVAVGEVTAPLVRSWVAEKANQGAGPATIERALGMLRQILEVAVESGNLAANPVERVKAPKREHRGRGYLSHTQVRELALAAGSSSTLIYFLAYTGLRFGEAAALRVRDVDLARRRIRVERSVVEVGGEMVFGTPKTHEKRTVPIPEFIAKMIAQSMHGRGRDDLLFGNGLAPVRLNNWRRRDFQRALRACQSVDRAFPTVTVHDLRHTCASLAVSAGANIKALQRMLGHASAAQLLDTYADLFDSDLDEVVDRLDEAMSVFRRDDDVGGPAGCGQNVGKHDEGAASA